MTTQELHFEPQFRVGRGWISALVLANLGLFMAFLTPIQVLLAEQIDALSPSGKEVALGWATGVGALVAVVANPLAGALSDRTRGRFGRRRPWILGGAVLGAVGLAVTAAQTTVVGVALGWCLAQLGLNAMLAGTNAVVPDQVPVRQRAAVSGFLGIPMTLGLVVGAVLVTMVVTGIATGYLLLAVLTVLCALPFVFLMPDPHVPASAREPVRLKDFWVSPRAYPDFGWAWLTRFLVMLGNAMGTLYLLYFLKDAVHYANPDEGVLILTLLYTAGVAVTAVAGGAVSDRLGRRRALVAVGSAVMAAASLLLSLWHTWPMAMGAAALLGLGFGMYIAVDQALITQVLPQAGDRAKDLGVINVANSAPQVLGPALAAPVVAYAGGYAGLYLTSSVVTLLGGVLVWKIRSVP
ncbi:putative MFS family arabinose efflux permease [Streptomyces sp. SLBN-118]|uniref:MFS transporter n=1 Tax=Streptomyces sp. SLBN-118 TaxID=2768454 RepID=UPI0011530975|nr:MFS transporter [Streptomyces sp. SLBN-118]TQK51209.1 putative MFS family arabinose efflux permease [Streptomyces sp. SLBN-118]